MANKEAVIELGGRISSLRAEQQRLAAEQQRVKSELRAAEAELDRLLKSPADTLTQRSEASPVATPAPNSFAADDFNQRSLNQRIIELLDSEPTRQFSAEDVCHKYPDARLNSVRSAMARLSSLGKIRRSTHGLYQAAGIPLGSLIAS